MLKPLLIAICVAAPGTALSATQCGRHDSVVSFLGDRYGEIRHGIGIAGNDAVMEIFASADTGTWTIVVTTADGATCLLASGEGFRATAEAAPPKGDPA